MTRRPKEAGLWDYLKEAFFYRWNLLLFLGAGAAALLTPRPDILVPLVGAAELLYLAGLTSIGRFRAAVDAKVHARNRPPVIARSGSADTTRALSAMLNELDAPTRQRFQRLRRRCVEMQTIAHGVGGRTRSDESGTDDIRTPALDRLLWVFLRLLYSQQALGRFLSATDEDAIRKRLETLREKEQASKEKGDERILRSLKDSISTAQIRLENYQKAQGNAEFVSVEIERIEQKIRAISEMSVSHQDPDFISSQVDSVAESMTHTEKAIRELNHITGLTDEMEGPPPIMESDVPEVIER